MIQSPKILWGEGLFLRRQHFQQQDAYHEWRLAQMSRLLHPYAWGVRHVKIDPDALQTGLLRLLELQVVLPDGELFNAPGEDELPPAGALSSIAQDGAGGGGFPPAPAPPRAPPPPRGSPPLAPADPLPPRWKAARQSDARLAKYADAV